MGPKLLGGGASLLAVAFILALPTIFKGEPADEVEPIEFGPPPVMRLADAVRADTPSPSPPAPVPPASAAAVPDPAPVVASGGGGTEGETTAAGAEGALFRDDSGESGDDDERASGADDEGGEAEDDDGDEDTIEGRGGDKEDD